MKKFALYVLSFITILSLTQCVKDEMIEIEENETTDVGLYVNEVLSTGDPDWIELYNATSEEIDLSGYKVSDGPSPKYTIPAGQKIAAKSYLVIECSTILTNFALSSGGEEVYVWDAAENLLDNIAFPALDAGISFGRTSDGAATLSPMSPTKGVANSNVNESPNLVAELISGVNDNERFEYTIIASDAGGIRDVKFFMATPNDVYFLEMAPVGGGEYIVKLPLIESGLTAEYYVVASDETGKKTFFPETAPDTKASFTVADGLSIFNSVELSNENPSNAEDIVFTVNVFDASGVSEVSLYYVINNDIADNKIKLSLTSSDKITWTGTIPGQADETKISYYLRAVDNKGVKSYYPFEELDAEGNVVGDFDHDDAASWPNISVAPLPLLNALVINEIQTNGSPDFIELFNGTNASIDISGYRIYDAGINASQDFTDAYIVPAGTSIAAGGFYVIEPEFGISKTSDDIFIENASGQKVLEMLGANWPAMPIGITNAYVVARKKDAADLWERRTVETKGTSNN
jgi:hypothetical protein